MDYLDFLNHCKLDKERLEIGSSGGGSISYYYDYAKIEKIWRN